MSVNLKLLVQLRAATFASISDCKKALEATNNNLPEAHKWLREHGIMKGAKIQTHAAKEGLIIAQADAHGGVLLEIKCETDFVARNSKIYQLMTTMTNFILIHKINNRDQLLTAQNDSGTFQHQLLHLSGLVGEKIEIGRLKFFPLIGKQNIGIYQHSNNKVAACVIGEDDITNEVLHNIAMHVVAMRPQFLSRDTIPSEFLKQEELTIHNQVEAENQNSNNPKSNNIIDKIIQGRFNKQINEYCLLNQTFVKDPSMTVKDYLTKMNVKVISFSRMELGEE